ncbi:unnamed protein product [Rhizoctonia solani]|uniref:Chromatin target of PRMT1 protein C-terminal domain-containing protein n=1 Tax=Rhizoctonia solani TaxID=456999 RepID=A0A8H2X0Z5_9AGAM|nr:unnamed protein product [Rhizoctonia solani]
MPMYADLLETGQGAALDFVLPYDQPDVKEPEEQLNEIEQLAEDLYGDGEKAPSSQLRVYTLEEYAPVLQGRVGKRKRELDTVEEGDEREDLDDDKLRPDALLLHGEPISKLSTEKIFEYVATYCDNPPISLEWIDDRTTVIVFESPDMAKSACSSLAKQSPEEQEPETLIPAHPVPKKMWPPEAQLDHNLSRGTALSGIMRIRRARFGDRKLKGARKRSEWYTRQQNKRSRPGDDDLDAELDEMKRRREQGDGEWETERAAALDRELDALAARKDGNEDGMDVESASRLQSRLGPRKNRQIAPLPRRRGHGHGRAPKEEKPRRTQEDLDAELEAFMKDRE